MSLEPSLRLFPKTKHQRLIIRSNIFLLSFWHSPIPVSDIVLKLKTHRTKLPLVPRSVIKPQPFESHVYDYSEQEGPHCFPGIPIKPNAESVYLGVGNWCWGPFHDRTECWYLHRGDTHWLQWFGLDHKDR